MRTKSRLDVLAVALFVAFAFVTSLALAQGPSKDWSEKELKDFAKKPWTQDELNKMGRPPRYVIKKEIEPRFEGTNLTPEQLYRNGQRQHRAWMLQYGIGISSKDFYKLWIEQEAYKDPKIKLLDVRQESEYTQARVPGAIRVDTGLAYWQLPGKAPDPTITYYLMCKGGDPGNGGSRGAMVKKFMLDMGYSGKIINITDGFRGWMENGFPVVNDHGLFVLLPGTFQILDKDAPGKAKEVGTDSSTASMGLAQKWGLKDW
ncbi:MAG: rhodanese-like domain-containing protein [Syntrophobacteraceae bacterium]